MKRKIALLVAGALLVASLAFVACDDDDDEDGGGGDGAGVTTVNVALAEWSVAPDQLSVPAGSVTFHATNEGEEVHELVILKTDLGSDELPVVDGKVTEAEAGEVIGEIEEFAAGGEGDLTLDLEAGAYVLFCNIVEEEEDGELESHYEQGMRVAFTVE